MCVKIIPVYQSFKLLKSNCFAVEILFNEDKMASFFSIAKSGFNMLPTAAENGEHTCI